MNNTLLDLSDKIESVFLELLEDVVRVAGALEVPFFVVGATARDIILEKGYGVQTIRATHDIDLGAQVSSWDEYKRLEEALIATKLFSKTRESQRYSYKDKLHLDIVPFGLISRPNGSISWPPEHDVVMNILGFEESYRHSIKVRLRRNPILEIQFSSLPGLVAMKLLSWNDNRPLRRKDAQDLSLIMQKYLEAGNEERLYNKESDLVDDDFDYIVAGARLLGRDVASILNTETEKAILAILERETDEGNRLKLVEDMVLVDATLTVTSVDDFDKKFNLLQQFKQGMLDI